MFMKKKKDLYNLIWSKHTSRLKSSFTWSMLPDLPSESSRLFVKQSFLERPKLNSHSWIAIFYIPLGVMLACLFQMSSVCLAQTYPSPDCPFLPTENVKSKPPFPGNLLWRGWLCPFPPDMQDHGFSGRKMEGDMRGKKKFPAQGLHVDREIFFLSNSEILTGITSQDSKCFLSCYNPLKFFFSIRPVILSVFLTHSAWCPSSTLQASPRDRERGLGGFQVYGPL